MTDKQIAARNTLQFFHININCTDLDRSVVFYKVIGFKVVLDFARPPGSAAARSFEEIGLGPVLRLPNDLDARACLMALSDETRETRLDLIQWSNPVVPAVRRRNLAQPGVARICLKVRDSRSLYADLIAAGYTPYTAPEILDMGGSRFRVFCCDDPDEVVMEFMEFLRD